jgi:protein-S-isoprenylcysteine O-methyltransferase Ste14
MPDMELYGQKSKSIPQKIVIHLLEIFFLWLSYWILFQSGAGLVSQKLGIHNASPSILRRSIIFGFSIIAFIRLGFMMFCLLKRKIPWEESISIPMAFALYYVGFSLFVLPTARPVDSIDIIGVVIFITGSAINTMAEVLRKRWKEQPGNKDKIYTRGLFKWSMHINYFGDLLWVSAYAILTRNIYSLTIPLFLFCFFAFYNIPKLDRYLSQHYGQAFEEYTRKTRKFIPFLY